MGFYTLRLFLITLIMLFSPSMVVAGDDAAVDSVIKIGIGETEIIPFDGINPFIADEEIAGFKAVLANSVSIIGKKGGTTNLYYWKEGVLLSVTIEVSIPEIFSSALLTPQFLANRPYFEYFFSNSSSFSQTSFYDSASYFHNLNGLFPFASGTTVRMFGTFTHQATGTRSVPVAGLVYQGRYLKWNFGNTSSSSSQLLSHFSGASFAGSNLEYQLPTHTKANHKINAFAGTVQPTDYLDLTLDDKKLYGAHYSMTRSREDSLFPDFLNASFTRYQAEDDSSFHDAGIVDGSLHVGKNLSLGAGYARDMDGGFVTVFNPRLESKSGLTEAKYEFVQSGLQEFGTDTILEDSHTYSVSSQYMLKDQTTLIGVDFFQEIVLPTVASTAVESNTLTGGLSYSRRASFKQGYGFNYQFSRLVEDADLTLGNSIGATLTHPVFNSSYLLHNINYSRSDLNESSNAVTVFSSFNTELEDLRYSGIFTGNFSRGSTDNESVSFGNLVELSFKKAILSGNLVYQKSSLRDGNHQFLFTPAISYQPTTVDFFYLSGGLALLVNNDAQISGSTGIQYRRLFGPGVVSDSLIKRLLRGGQKSVVEGDVFLDKNYNTVFDKEDQPLANVQVKLDGGKTVVTDDKGHYIFPKLKAGTYKLSINPSSLSKLPDIHAAELEKITEISFTSSGIYPITLPVPLHYKSAKLLYKFILDVNENGKIDPEDKYVSVSKIHVDLPNGEKMTFSTSLRSQMVRGLTSGRHKVWIDFLDIPENVDAVSPVSQFINITKYEEQIITYFFRPIRFLRGQIKTDGSLLPRGLRVRLGAFVSSVDSKGYYWLKNLKPGDFKLTVEGMSQGKCMEKTTQTALSIPPESFMGVQDITLTTQCQ